MLQITEMSVNRQLEGLQKVIFGDFQSYDRAIEAMTIAEAQERPKALEDEVPPSTQSKSTAPAVLEEDGETGEEVDPLAFALWE